MERWLCDFNKKGRYISSIEDFDNYENLIGFVYKITNLKTGRFYIGKKSFYHKRKTKIGKREKAATKTRKRYKVVVKESNWLVYHGSCKELNKDIQQLGPDPFRREILETCCSKKYLNFCEVEHQIKNDVLKINSYNGNILGKYYSQDMKNCKN